MIRIRGTLTKICILTIIFLTTSCVATSKHKYKQRRRRQPCDCPIWGQKEVISESEISGKV